MLETPPRIRQGMGNCRVPVVVLARLAVAKAHQGQRIGIGMLHDAIRRSLLIADHAVVRALLTHPLGAEAERFYSRLGFIASPLREQQLLLLLKDARG